MSRTESVTRFKELYRKSGKPLSALVDYQEAYYRETGNPLYVWEAVSDYCPPGEPLPGWIEDYLRGCASRLLDMADPRAASPEKAAGQVAQALGLTRTGWNAFAAHHDDSRAAMVAMLYERRAESAEVCAEGLAAEEGVHPRTVQNWVKRARKLLDAALG